MSAFIKWIKRLEDITTPWTENEIKYFRKAIGPCGIGDEILRRGLSMLFQEGVYRITPEQDRKGQEYLLRRTLKKDGSFRRGAKLSPYEVGVLQTLDYHLFTALYRQGNQYLPIYRAVSTNGDWFEYVGTYYEMMRVLL